MCQNYFMDIDFAAKAIQVEPVLKTLNTADI
jgi:hypothetical protein